MKHRIEVVPISRQAKASKKFNAKETRREYMRNWYAQLSDEEKNARKQHAAVAMRASRVRAMTTAYTLLGGKCEKCGNNDMRVLELDHVNNDGFTERLGKHAMCRRVLETPERFQLLCANCHTLKHHTEWRGRRAS